MILKIYNRGRLFSIAKVCNTLFLKSRGLMFTRRLKQNESLLIPTSQPLTMLFVFYQIDIVFLDKNNKILDIKKTKPFVPYISSEEKYSSVLELPCGKSSSLKIGETLDVLK